MLIKPRAITILAVSLMGVVLLAGLGRQIFEAQTRVPTPPPLYGSAQRQRWEYCVVNEISLTTLGWKAHVSHGGNIETVDSDMTGISVLNRLGGEGWELVGAAHESGNSVEYFLKRPMR
ncbi:MAG TPA: hypothetical protein VE961_07640 [Pyrinomonadaceae bacterium]|nr:hypothetical protein [Pyrinomonadaceae bacterium]